MYAVFSLSEESKRGEEELTSIRRKDLTQSCRIHTAAVCAYASREKLENDTKSNIECNSGISKDI
jgi:LmbE family N-acetylglucosaminyl deacetylase